MNQLPEDDDVKTQYIKGIYNSVVLKDVIQKNNLRDPELLERILIYIMDNIGQIFSAKKVTDYLKSQGRKVGVESVYSYINALENAMILFTARRYDIKGKKVLERMEKYFLASEEVIERECYPLRQIRDNYKKTVISLDKISIGIAIYCEKVDLL